MVTRLHREVCSADFGFVVPEMGCETHSWSSTKQERMVHVPSSRVSFLICKNAHLDDVFALVGHVCVDDCFVRCARRSCNPAHQKSEPLPHASDEQCLDCAAL